jgi:hypothetical protein
MPEVQVPDDFENILYRKISKLEDEKPASILEKIFFPKVESHTRVLIYSTVTIIALCSIVLIYMITRSVNTPKVIEPTSVDSTYYQGKKVFILPPTSPEQSDQVGQQPLQEMVEPSKKSDIDKNHIDKYFSTPDTSSDEYLKSTSTRVHDSSKHLLVPHTTDKVTGAKLGIMMEKKKPDTIHKKKKLK